MISCVCVLFEGGADVPEWSRGVYDETWVEKLYRGIARNIGSEPFELVCMVDRWRKFAEPVRQVILATTKPNWQALMEMFRPELNIQRGIGLGLDTVIVGSVAQLATYAGDFATTSDPWNPLLLSNGVVCFSFKGACEVWRAWESRSGRFDLGRYPSEMQFMRDALPDPERLERLYPGQLVSYKAHVAPHGRLDNARIVYFHGIPKPNQMSDVWWVKEHWR